MPTEKTICQNLTVQEIELMRNVFVTRFTASFIQKHRKYIKLLGENGSSLTEAFSTCSVNFSASFEDEVNIIVSEKRHKIQHVCKLKGVYSLKGLFRQVYQIVRRARASRIESKLLDIKLHDILDSLTDIGSELAFAYEYQIAMLSSDQDVRHLADHAVSCAMNYLKQSDASFNRCNLLEAITDTAPCKSLRRAEKVVTKIMKTDHVKGTRPQKWRFSEIFKQPGLRIPKTDGDGYLFYGCFTPYGCLCRPDKYGFRGPIHVWDDKLSKFVLLYNDQVSTNTKHSLELDHDLKNVHQNYEPVMLCSHVLPDSNDVNSTTSELETNSNNASVICNEDNKSIDNLNAKTSCARNDEMSANNDIIATDDIGIILQNGENKADHVDICIDETLSCNPRTIVSETENTTEVVLLNQNMETLQQTA